VIDGAIKGRMRRRKEGRKEGSFKRDTTAVSFSSGNGRARSRQREREREREGGKPLPNGKSFLAGIIIMRRLALARWLSHFLFFFFFFQSRLLKS
jgi:hypothetical protein